MQCIQSHPYLEYGRLFLASSSDTTYDITKEQTNYVARLWETPKFIANFLLFSLLLNTIYPFSFYFLLWTVHRLR